MNFRDNYFDLFSLAHEYWLDEQQLLGSYVKLQRQFHPDKFVSQTASEQRLATQFAAHLNTAYQTLSSPVLRAQYLLLLAGIEVDTQAQTLKDVQFLMRQLQWQEQLADMASLTNEKKEAAITALRQVLDKESDSMQQLFAEQLAKNALLQAKESVAKLHFIDKTLLELSDLEASLFDE